MYTSELNQKVQVLNGTFKPSEARAKYPLKNRKLFNSHSLVIGYKIVILAKLRLTKRL